jgi:hypothetical protein
MAGPNKIIAFVILQLWYQAVVQGFNNKLKSVGGKILQVWKRFVLQFGCSLSFFWEKTVLGHFYSKEILLRLLI